MSRAMSHRVSGTVSLALGCALILTQVIAAAPQLFALAPVMHNGTAISPAQRAALDSRYGQLPLGFELNAGQDADAAVRFVAHRGGYRLALTPTEALLALAHPTTPSAARSSFALPGQPTLTPPSAAPPTVLGMAWLGANPHPTISGEQPLPGTVDYYIGNEPARWRTNIPTYAQVRYHDVYPGVDLVYYGSAGGQLEYDFVVAPGADPSRIALGFTGADRLGVDLLGNLHLALPDGTLQQDKPLIYQSVGAARQHIAGGYTLGGAGRVGFALGAYNPHLPLVIDPAYKFSTFLGGTGADVGAAIAVDSGGGVYVTGQTTSPNFPQTGQVQFLYGPSDAFVSVLNAAGTSLAYSAYLGGSGDETGTGIAVDASSHVYVTGWTTSTNFPVTSTAPQPAYGGGSSDAFVTKINPWAFGRQPRLLYSTYLGGSGADAAFGIAIDSSGNAYVTGQTPSTNFPTTTGVVKSAFPDTSFAAFVSKLNATGTALVYSTYLGGSSYDSAYAIAVDASGIAYVTGQTASDNFPTTTGAFQPNLGGTNNAFVTKLNSTASALVYSTYLGGSIRDEGTGIAIDSSGNAYLTGYTYSTNFPTTPGAFQATYGGGTQDGFVTKVNALGSALVYSSYLGGSGDDQGNAIAVDGSGSAYVTGTTISTNFPLTSDALRSNSTGTTEAFVSRVNAAGSSLTYSSYLGGINPSFSTGTTDGVGIALGANATAYVTGETADTTFPISNALSPTYGGGTDDAFITKIATHPSVDTTTGVFRPSNGTLYLKNSNTTGNADLTLAYGLPGDLPVTGDWTGKGYRSIGVYRNGTFYLRNTNTTGPADLVIPFGTNGDLPVAGDWSGRGYDSIGVFRPSTATFYLRYTLTSGPADFTIPFGTTGDVPIVGDWTGKGWDSIGVWRPATGNVFLRNTNTTGPADIAFTFGASGDKPVVGDWNADTIDTIGVDRNGLILLRNSNTTGPADVSFYLGVAGDDPIAGPWLAPVGGLPPAHQPSVPSIQPAATQPRRPARTP